MCRVIGRGSVVWGLVASQSPHPNSSPDVRESGVGKPVMRHRDAEAPAPTPLPTSLRGRGARDPDGRAILGMMTPNLHRAAAGRLPAPAQGRRERGWVQGRRRACRLYPRTYPSQPKVNCAGDGLPSGGSRQHQRGCTRMSKRGRQPPPSPAQVLRAGRGEGRSTSQRPETLYLPRSAAKSTQGEGWGEGLRPPSARTSLRPTR